MTKLKKVSLAFLALICSTCLILGAGFFMSFGSAGLTASAATYDVVASDLDIREGVLHGFAEGKVPASYKYFNLVIPANVTEIAPNAFDSEGADSVDCSNMLSVTLPAGTNFTKIGDSAFAGCENLLEVIVPADSTFAGQITLGSNDNGGIAKYAKNVSSVSSMHTTESTGFGWVYDKANEVVEGDTVTEGAWILYDYVGTETGTLMIPAPELHNGYISGSYTIYKDAFRNAGFKDVTFSGNVTSIGAYAFAENENFGGAGATIIIPSGVTEIGAYAFFGCTSLMGSSITMEQGVKTIGDYAFANCTSLDLIRIPGSVEQIKLAAFSGCSALERVEFLPFTREVQGGDGSSSTVEEVSKLTLIGNNAFNGTILKVVEIPEGVTQIGAGAFLTSEGSLGFAYLPNDAEFINIEDNTPCFNNVTRLICKDSSSYDLNYAKPALSAHRDQLTYVIKVKGYADNAAEPNVTVDKLYKNSYSLTKVVSTADSVDDGLWQDLPAAEVKLPVQSRDYSVSVWYKTAQSANETFAGDKVDIAYLNAELAKKVDEIRIYAPLTWARPADGASTSWTYDENLSVNLTASAVLSRFAYPSTENFAIISSATYLAANAASGSAAVNLDLENDKIANAGTYSITVDLDEEKYGLWSTPAVLTVNVTRKSVDLITELTWTASADGKELALRDSTARYIYIDEDGVPRLARVENTADTVFVMQSYVYFQNKEVTLAVAANNKYFTASTVNGAKGTAADVYQSSVTLTATNNYMFATSLSSDATMLGIQVEYDDLTTRTQATVTKTWYIVQVDNMLTTVAGGDTEFSVADWVFGSNATLNAPFLKRGATSDMSFELYKDGALVGAFEYGQYSHYVNATMPVGAYVLTANVKSVNGADGATNPFVENFSFNVTPATIRTNLFSTSNARNYEYELTTSNTRYTAFDQAIKVIGDLMTARGAFLGNIGTGPQTVTPEGYWLEHRTEYYAADNTDYTVTFRYMDSSSNVYYTYDDESLWSRISPRSFNVYFNIEMKNHIPVNQSANYDDKYFTITVFQKVASPVISGNFVYTESDVKPDIESNSAYRVSWNDGEYVSAGNHTVTFELLNPTYYRWADTTHVDANNAALLTLDYTVAEADNVQLTTLYLLPWSYGDKANSPVWATRFGSAANYTFTLTKGEGDNKQEFVYGSETNGFDKAEAGTYTLTAECKLEENVKPLTVTTSFEIRQATNRWEESPNIRRWALGEYEQTASTYRNQMITAKPAFGDKVILTITRVSGNVTVYEGYLTWTNDVYSYSEYNGKTLDKVLEGADAGEYVMRTQVLATANYSLLDSNTEFKIFPLGASSSNAWRKLPSIASWKVDDIANELYEGEAYHDGARTVKYYLASDYEANGANATELGNKPATVGSYVVVITVEPTEDAYNNLVAPIYFDILAADVVNPAYPALAATMFVIGIGIAVLAAVVVVMLIRRTKVK